MCSNLETNMQIIDTSNERIFNRNLSSQPLQPYLSVRPVMTKYSILPIVDPRAPISVPLEQQPTYNSRHVFNPGNTVSPWSGFATNINLESELRNQVYALQKCSQSVYVPSSSSDLYHFQFKPKEHSHVQQPFPNLFKKELYSDFNPNNEEIAKGAFYNHTRQQLKGLSENQCD